MSTEKSRYTKKAGKRISGAFSGSIVIYGMLLWHTDVPGCLPGGDARVAGVDGSHVDAELEGAVGWYDAVVGLAVGQAVGDVDHPVVALGHVLQGCGVADDERGDGGQRGCGGGGAELAVVALVEDFLAEAVDALACGVIEPVGGGHHPTAITDAHGVAPACSDGAVAPTMLHACAHACAYIKIWYGGTAFWG